MKRALYIISAWLFSLTAYAQYITGTSPAVLGNTYTYTFNRGIVYSYVTWQVPNGALMGTWSSGTNYYANIKWMAPGNPTTITVRDQSNMQVGSMSVVVNVPDPSTSFTYTQNCGSTDVTRTSTPPTGVNWYWQTSSTGTSTSLGFAATINRTSTSTLWLRARWGSTGQWSLSSLQVPAFTIITTPPAAPASSTDGHRISNTAVTVPISVGAVSGATSYRWYTQASGGTAIAGQTTTSYSPTLSATQAYYVTAVNGNCESTTRRLVTANVYPEALISATHDGAIPMGGQVQLSVDNFSYSTYSWYRESTLLTACNNSSTCMIDQPGNYRVDVSKNSSPVKPSLIKPIVKGVAGQNQNYIVTNIIQKKNVTLLTDVDNLNADLNIQSVQYFDGLGRPMQTISTQGSPLKKDIVQPVAYDVYDREIRKFLPVVLGQITGRYTSSIVDAAGNLNSTALNFYNNSSDKIADDTRPYGETIYEASPLNRPEKDFGPGNEWYINNKAVQHQYLVNVNGTSTGQEQVIAWNINGSNMPVRASTLSGYIVSGGYYATGQLQIKSTKDENGKEVREYTNKSGQVILKKVQTVDVNPTPSNRDHWAMTYYIYDNLGNLRFVLQPELCYALHANGTNIPNSTDLDNFAFQYSYDDRGRMTHKKVPGADVVYLVYDNRDRLVMTQDGNQRKDDSGNITKKEWTFTKYDWLNRPIITGIYTHSSVVDQAGMIGNIVTAHETYNGTTATHGYTNTVFPTSNTTVLTATYYDNYNFKTMQTGLNYSNNSLSVTNVTDTYNQLTAEFLRVKGKITGTKVNILSTSSYLFSATYYDDRNRVIQTIAQNHKSGTDRVSNLYDFTGKVLQTRRTYIVSGVTRYVRETFTYDHAGRLLNVKHSTNGATDVMTVKNEYNELGQLVDKQLHSTDNGVTFKQSVDHRYNIRGWLTKINEADVSSLAPGETLEDYFGVELAYNNTLSGISSNTAYNGSITAVKWSTGALGGANLQGYYYNYDAMNRFKTSGHYKDRIFTGWGLTNANLETDFVYDLNGNIKNLKRQSANATTIDNLSYFYTGNRLTYVNDTADPTLGFVNGNTGTDDYAYDANGNMKLDKNKGITAIAYNHLNLPRQVNKGASDYIVYTYDATGRKLTQQVFGTTPKTTDYIGEFVFEGTTPALKIINHSEGRILPDGANWEYQYHLKDHLGNVRVTFTAKAQTPVTSTANFETTTNSNFVNYSFISFDLVDHTDAGTTYTKAQWLNGGNSGRVGVGKSIAVMPGDKVSINAYAKYMNLGSTPNSTSFIAALATAFGTYNGAPGELGKLYNGLNSYAGFVPGGDHPDDDEGAPKAFVTILLFDKDYNLVDAAWKQMTTVGLQSSGIVKQPPHDQLFKEVTISEPGYAYVFVSNEHPTYVDVYFDDVTVTHTPSPVVFTSDYYPFGLVFNSYQRENSVPQDYKYNSKEEQTELGLGWLDYGARMYQPELGRFFTQDRFADSTYSFSPYHYAANNPILFVDVNGDSVNVAAINVYDNANGTSVLNTTIADLNAQTGMTFSMSASGQLVYQKDANGNAVIATTTDANGNTVQVGSAEARNIMMSAINNTTTVTAMVSPGRSAAPLGGTVFGINTTQINAFMAGANNVDPKTLGYGMTLMHEILHTAVGLSQPDAKGFGNTGAVVDRMNIVRQELNSQGGNYGHRTSYEGLTFSPTGNPAYIPFDNSSLRSLQNGNAPIRTSKHIKY